MGLPRIAAYTVRYADTQLVEENVFGIIWTVDRQYYFDKLPANNQITDWVARYNQMTGTGCKNKKELMALLGSKEALKDFKKSWAKKYLPRIDKYVCVG